MGQKHSKAPAGAPPARASGAPSGISASHEAMRLYTRCWYGTAPQHRASEQRAGAGGCAALPLYDSDDETTDTAVVSALAMTDPADLSTSYATAITRMHCGRSSSSRTKAPILQPLGKQYSGGGSSSSSSRRGSASAQDAAALAALADAIAAAAAGGSAAASAAGSIGSPLSTPTASLSPSQRLQQPSLASAAAGGAAAGAALLPQPLFSSAFPQQAAAAGSSRSGTPRSRAGSRPSAGGKGNGGSGAGGSSGRAAPARQPQQQQHARPGRHPVPLSAAALRAAGMPCEIGGDLPPASLQSQRASGADTLGLRPYHHLRMMQLHQQQQAAVAAAAKHQALCAQVQAASVWGWAGPGSQSGGATPVAT